MLTNDQIQDARRRAAEMLAEAEFVLTEVERDGIEVADFGLSARANRAGGRRLRQHAARLREGDRGVARPDLPRAPPPSV